MKKIFEIPISRLLLLALLSVVWIAASGVDVFAHSNNPVYLVGTILPAQEQSSGSTIDIYTLHVQGTNWRFAVKDVIEPRRGGATPSDVLNDIIVPEISLVGSPKMIASLKDPGIAGKTVELEGFVYTDTSPSRMYVGTIRIIS